MGVLSVLCVLVVGVTLGALAGYYGGWIDAVLARLGDIFFALPLILGALVITQLPLFRENKSVWTVVFVIALLAWPQMARITRGAVIEVRNCGLRHRGPRFGRLEVRGAGPARPAERPGTDHRPGDPGTGRVHRGRSHPVLPGHWPPAEHHVLGQ